MPSATPMSVIFVRQSIGFCLVDSMLIDCMKTIRVNSIASLCRQEEGKGWRQKRQKGAGRPQRRGDGATGRRGDENRKRSLLPICPFALSPRRPVAMVSPPHSLLFTQKFPDAVLTVGRLPRDDVQIHAGAE